MGCSCGKKSKRYMKPEATSDYYSKYAFLTPAQLAAKKAQEESFARAEADKEEEGSK